MEKKYQIIRDKVLKGTKRAIDKLVIESEKTVNLWLCQIIQKKS